MALGDIIDAIADELAHVAPMARNAKELARFTKLPRYIVVRLSVGPSARRHSRAGSLQEDAYENQIHCEAASEADCEAMRRALIQAARHVMKGGNYKEGKSEWVEPDDAQSGVYKLVVPLTIYEQLPFATLPAQPSGVPAVAVKDAKSGEVTIEDVEIDPSGAVAGDNELQGGEG
jgi:hypothetical protein